jgi:hypothetical protein
VLQLARLLMSASVVGVSERSRVCRAVAWERQARSGGGWVWARSSSSRLAELELCGRGGRGRGEGGSEAVVVMGSVHAYSGGDGLSACLLWLLRCWGCGEG